MLKTNNNNNNNNNNKATKARRHEGALGPKAREACNFARKINSS